MKVKNIHKLFLKNSLKMCNKKLYEKYMRKALKLALKGKGKTSPNPIVGAVLLDKDLNFVSEGYHKKYGEAHAEVNAINSAIEQNKNIKGGTIIVTLEPCSHYGKTPPCADLIIKSGIKTVVIGCKDTNKLVSGKGIEKLKASGLDVITGILEDECKQANERFFKNHKTNQPFIIIKTATTLDGKIATKNGSSKWITGEKARKDVQKLRNSVDAILTSSKTVITDNPSLTCRFSGGKNPVRIIVDSNLKTSPDSKVFANDGTKIYLATIKKAQTASNYPKNVEILTIKEKDGHVDLKALVSELYKKGICSILVEAGGMLNGAFVKEHLADKLIKYTAPKILGDNEGKSFIDGFKIDDINDSLNLTPIKITRLGNDIKTEYRVI